MLAWARELGPGALLPTNLPVLPPSLAPLPSPRATVDGAADDTRGEKFPTFRDHRDRARAPQTPPRAVERSDGVSNSDGGGVVVSGDDSCFSPVSPRAVGRGDEGARPGGRTLSIGGAWMLAHQAFGRRGMREPAGSWRPPQGVVDVSAGEANALGLLSCPDVGWAPEPREVMQALLDGGGALCGYTVSAESMGEGRRWGEAACEELVEAGLSVRAQGGGLLELDKEVGGMHDGDFVLHSYSEYVGIWDFGLIGMVYVLQGRSPRVFFVALQGRWRLVLFTQPPRAGGQLPQKVLPTFLFKGPRTII